MYTRTGILALCGLIAACAPAENPKQPIEDSLYTRDWQFMRSEAALDLAAAKTRQTWESVQLPHNPSIESVPVNDQFQGDAWYKKILIPAPNWQGKRISLRFEAAMNATEIWLNDEKLATHLGGYLPFSVDLTDKLKWDTPNKLWLRLDNRDNPITGPKPLKELEFNTYGGLYRPVYLQIDNDLHITDAITANKPASGGILVTYPEVTPERALINIQTHLYNAHYDPKQFRIVQRLMQGEKVVSDLGSDLLRVEGHSDAQNTIQLALPKPQLWSPRTPHLYRLVTRVYDGNSLVEEQSTRVGIREFKLIKGELFINGEKNRLRSVQRYQEYPYVGFATSAAADYRDAVHIKSAGFDAVHLAHYPQSPAFLDAADELGLVVINSIPGWGYFSEDPAFQAQAQQTCRDLIRRDRNHPSVLAWECSLGDAGASADFVKTMVDIVHEELPGSFTAGGRMEPADIVLLSHKDLPPHKNLPISPAKTNTAFWITADSTQLSATDDEKNMQQQVLAAMIAYNHSQSTHVLADTYSSMFDYNRGYAPHLQTSGLMSSDRQPKYAYYFFQSQRDPDEKSSQFQSGPMVFIASHWTTESALNIPIFSNADQVELLLNGKSLGKKIPERNITSSALEHPPFLFTLEKFIPGELKAIAYRDGKIVAEHRVITPGDATSLRMRLNSGGKPPQTGTKDLLFVYAQLIDTKGNPVTTDGVAVNFTLQGDSKLINPKQTHTHNGSASALIEIGESLEGLSVTAHAEPLPPATLYIQ